MIRVAIIDDEYFFRNNLKNNFPWEKYDMQVIGDANDGNSGLNLILQEAPDLAIVDINMPIFNGLELIRRSQDAGAKTRFIILTGYDEFKYAQTAVSLNVGSYVLKPVDFNELADILAKEKHRLEQLQLQRDAMDTLRRQADYQRMDRSFNAFVNFQLSPAESEKLHGLFSEFKNFCAIIFAPKNLPDSQKCENLRSQLAEEGRLNHHRLFIDGKMRMVFVADIQSMDESSRLITEISPEINAWLGDCEISTGQIYESFSQVPLSYSEGCIALQNHIIYSEFNENHENKFSMVFSPEREFRLKNALVNLDKDKVREELHASYQILYEKQASFDVLVLTTLHLVMFLVTTLSQRNADTSGVLSSDAGILDRLARFQSVEAFRDWVLELYIEGIHRLLAQQNGLSNITLKVQEYIRARLCDSDLSIKRISEDLYLNYSYLCVTFKSDTGMTINDFILSERMEKAKYIFDAGAVNIARVAQKVGFDDAGYFSKCFRKIYGISPSAYIQNIAADT